MLNEAHTVGHCCTSCLLWTLSGSTTLETDCVDAGGLPVTPSSNESVSSISTKRTVTVHDDHMLAIPISRRSHVWWNYPRVLRKKQVRVSPVSCPQKDFCSELLVRLFAQRCFSSLRLEFYCIMKTDSCGLEQLNGLEHRIKC